MKHKTIDDGDSRRYWTQVPNIVFTLGLSPYELTLYVHLKQTAGADGLCWKSTATLARETKMSAGMISKAKGTLERGFSQLGGKSLINVTIAPNPHGGYERHLITLTDVWPENVAHFASSPDEHVIEEPSSQGERHVHDVNAQVHDVNVTSSPHEPNKNPINKNPIIKTPEEKPLADKPPTDFQLLMKALADRTGAIRDGAAQGDAINWLLKNGYSVDESIRCLDSLLADDWRKRRESWLTVAKEIGTWKVKRNTHVPQVGKYDPSAPVTELDPPEMSDAAKTEFVKRFPHMAGSVH